jgi:MarR family transcriptional regulator, organic hydroperoxide resistance regulator
MAQSRTEMMNGVLAAMARLYQSPPRQSIDPWIQLELTTAQVRTLAILSEDEAITIGRVGELLGVTLPTASHLVDKLVRSGFAERSDDPLDRRRAVVRPSPRGAELMRSLREFNLSYLQECLTQMDDADVAALQQGMAALADAAQALKRAADASPASVTEREPAQV